MIICECGKVNMTRKEKEMFEKIGEKEESIGEMVQRLDISPSLMNWHLKKFQKAGLITKDRKGRKVYYKRVIH